MQTTKKDLTKSRIEYTVELDETEVSEYFAHAVSHLASSVKVPGFRQGKAPADIVRSHLKPEDLREEAYALAARASWNKIAETSQELPIEDPAVEVVTFEEGQAGKLVFSFDVRPEVKLGAWQKIKVEEQKVEPVTREEVEAVILSLKRSNAQTVVKVGPTEMGDKVEATFSGSIGGVKNPSLSATKFPIVLGQGSVIPGFESELIGLKRGEEKTFTLNFPTDHFDKQLSGKKIEFEVKIDEVFKMLLPEEDENFAEKFGHKTYPELKTAIEDDLNKQKADEAFIQRKAKWLSEFDKVISSDVPASLIQTEVERSRQAWASFLMERNLNPKDWLEKRETTMEKMEEDWRNAAESSVRIGLGLSEVAKTLGKELKGDSDYQELLDTLIASGK